MNSAAPIAVIEYNAGNTQSVVHALHRLGVPYELTGDAAKIKNAARVIFPGVGEARSTMNYLRERGLAEVIRSLRQPVLGICLGLQLLCKHSEENDTECLGVFDLPVKRFGAKPGYKVPHMGWNRLADMRGPLFTGLEGEAEPFVYFVHSFYAPVAQESAAMCDHAVPFSAALMRDNFYAVQFHPEKSAAFGERILKNFLTL